MSSKWEIVEVIKQVQVSDITYSLLMLKDKTTEKPAFCILENEEPLTIVNTVEEAVDEFTYVLNSHEDVMTNGASAAPTVW